MSTAHLEHGPVSGLADGERLRSGVWPRAWALWGLVVYMTLILIRPWEQLIPELAPFHFERLIVIVMLAITLLAGKWSATLNLQSVAFLCLSLVALASTVNAFIPELAVPVVIELTGMFLFYLFVLCLVRSPYQAVFFVACYLAILGIYQAKCHWEYFLNGGGSFRMGVQRLQGIELSYGHPNTLAFTILSAMPFWYFLFCVREQVTRGWPRFWRTNFLRFLYVFPVMCVVSVLLTRSRAGTLGLVVVGILIAMRSTRRTAQLKSIFAVAIICVVGFFVVPQDIRLRIQSTWDSTVEQKYGQKGANSSAEGRWNGFLAGMEMLHEHPWLGVGIGNFKDYRVAKCKDKTYLSAHNLPGELLGELGVIGGCVFTLVIVSFYRYWRRIRRLAKNSMNESVRLMQELALACRDSVLVLGYESLSQHTLQRYQWYLVGALSVLAYRFAARKAYEADHSAQAWDCEVLESPVPESVASA